MNFLCEPGGLDEIRFDGERKTKWASLDHFESSNSLLGKIHWSMQIFPLVIQFNDSLSLSLDSSLESYLDIVASL